MEIQMYEGEKTEKKSHAKEKVEELNVENRDFS